MFGIRNKMTLKSALQDVRETTLAAVSGLLGKLRYLASLRCRDGRYEHWGITLVHGEESAAKALKTAHGEVLAGVLRSPISGLEADLQGSSQELGMRPGVYLQGMREQFDNLLPPQKDAAAAAHLNSVLVTLSALDKNPLPSTRSAS